ncbi:zinc finger AN1 and C2H2 domain-containing stress-associated protein 13 isoform X3 [Cajanus cajan]|uniref:zinc finger AN1 and C2H2 domain-containing stress-associated protein 13 isoform X3 n=1 Tax=Cajanus cajan TaxID=3821 RepID=UPI00098D94BE|nr:zinc finger AN1 and C2H2 domain-containing stress-associated protein 13 isoform X3 [Cajanus cajan]
MGTPEFPDLGKHCAVSDCKLIDFLPFTCDRCDQVYCLEHRSYIKHQCTKADKRDVTVVICPLCAKGVRLVPDQDPNITWENHVNTECDPSNYEKVTKKKKCPVPGCREILVFSNTIKCRDCTVDHCLKHRYGPDHKCPGPKNLQTSFSFMNILNGSKKEGSKPKSSSSASSKWTTSFLNTASNIRASAEAGVSKLSGEINQAWQTARGAVGQSHNGEERSGNRSGAKVTIDVCPKCSRGFRDPVSLVEHVERDHGGSSRA